ncbi:putative ribonuclease H-like domain-containing protein [Tanacetum coccineum]|uniref:Ribonuclease H-like domain-containing protein n=1 Tax=Tanacetum coccineum TaxID=301880 RepID=A0ABQ5CM68_9ASTR
MDSHIRKLTKHVSALKLPMLKTGDCDLWSMRMEQYLTNTDYALWEVIVNGDAPAIAFRIVLSTIGHEIWEQIDTDDLKEMDLNGRKESEFNGKETVGFDKTNVNITMPKRRGHIAREGNGICGYDWSFQAEEGITNFALMDYTSQGSSKLSSSGLCGVKWELNLLEKLGYLFMKKNEEVYEEDIAILNSPSPHWETTCPEDLTYIFDGLVDSVYKTKCGSSCLLKDLAFVDRQADSNQGFLIVDVRHMTGNKSFLTYYQEINGGFVAFGGSPKGGTINRKSKIRIGKLDFEDTECLVLSPDFKLLDESQVLLKVPRQNNMYSFDLKNVVPSGGLTCLFAKATIDESNLWHRRLGHINFKTMNKLVRGNLVRGLPSKLFENDHTCVACQKGKQHKASCKTKLVSSISQPLQMLHMDLFGPTSVRSINHKTYCLVVTDDYSRFSWVFFLATKDETSGILKTFITGIENQINHKVKIIRCDNGTEFKNNDMNQFCGMKGIKREFSVARTPQQNGVAERKNRTLIEAARTMLADSLLPTTFWAEAVSTACYVQNRVLVTKPHNKTPYELLHGRPPSISFMRPFGCPVTILNTLDPLGKFDGKADEGFFVGYSINSKAFRKNGYANNTNRDSTVSPSISAVGQSFTNADDLPTDPLMPDLEDTIDLLNTGIFSGAYDDEDVGAEADLNNLETTMNVSPIPITRIHKDHPKDQIIGDINSATQTRRMTKISEKHAMVSYIKKQKRTNHKDYQNFLFACFLLQIEPKKVTQAWTYPIWIKAMQDELLQFRLRKKDWRLVDLRQRQAAIGTEMGPIRNKKDEERIINDAQEIPDEFYGGAHFLLRVAAFMIDVVLKIGISDEFGMFITGSCKVNAARQDLVLLGEINDVKQIHATVDGKTIVISESLVWSDLYFNDEDGITCLTNETIFENLALMGGKSTLSIIAEATPAPSLVYLPLGKGSADELTKPSKQIYIIESKR